MTAWERLADAPFEKSLAYVGGGRWRVMLAEKDVELALPLVVAAFSAYRVPYPANHDRVPCFEVEAVEGRVVFTARAVQGFMVSHAPDDLVQRYLLGVPGAGAVQLSITAYTPEQMAELYTRARMEDAAETGRLVDAIRSAPLDSPDDIDSLARDVASLRLLAGLHPSLVPSTRSGQTP